LGTSYPKIRTTEKYVGRRSEGVWDVEKANISSIYRAKNMKKIIRETDRCKMEQLTAHELKKRTSF
jgi:hypothetical protein